MDKRQEATLQKWIEQGYVERAAGSSVSWEEYQRRRSQNPSPAHFYFDHCKAQGIPLVEAVHGPKAKYATVGVDYITTDSQLSKAGQQELAALFDKYAGPQTGGHIGREGYRYSGARRVPVGVLAEMMPQVVAVVQAHSEPRELQR